MNKLLKYFLFNSSILTIYAHISHRGKHGFIKILALIGISLAVNTPLFALSNTVHSYTLNNGLTLLVKEDHRSPVVSNQLWYHVGSSYEPHGITGISHVLEHMMFKGTPLHPAGNFSREIAKLGGLENAATSQDFTFYYEEIPTHALEKVLALEADRMAHLTVDKKEFQKEIQVVMEERRMRVDNDPMGSTLEAFNKAAFLSIPYHDPVIGWMKDLRQLNHHHIHNWYTQWYGPNNATLVIVGDVNPHKVYRLVKRYFGSLPSITLPQVPKQSFSSFKHSQHMVVHKPAKVPFIVLGFHTPSLPSLKKTSKDPYALEMLSYLLAGSESARLPKILIRERALASAVTANYNPYSRLPDLFTLSAIPKDQGATHALEVAIMKEIEHLKNTPISLEELNRAKAQVIAHSLYEQDSMDAQGILLGSLASVGLSWHEIAHSLKQIQGITSKDIQEVAKKYLHADNLTVATLIPTTLAKKASS